MKKQNFGIPVMLLCVSAYLLAASSNFLALLALTIVVFAFGFEPKVKKTVLQASAFMVFFVAVDLVFRLLYEFIGTSGYGYTISSLFGDENSGINIFNKIVNLFNEVFIIGAMVIYVVLIICILIKNDIILQSITKAVDGFVPPQPNQFQQQQPMQHQMQQPMQHQMQQPNAFGQQPQQQQSQQQSQPQQFQQPQNPNQPR